MIHLHCHSSKGSRLDSKNTTSALAERAKELGMDAMALTDHGEVSALIDFYDACKENGVKPILGCEVYICDDMKVKDNNNRYDHLVLLAKTEKGYKNILKLSSLGYTEGFYYKPRIDYSTLVKYKEDIVVTTACLGGEIPRYIMNNKNKPNMMDLVENKIREFSKPFEDFYLEIQSANSPEQVFVNKVLCDISEKTGLPLVVTSDSHFLTQDDYEAHGIFIQVNQERDNEVYVDCWVKTEQEVFDVLEGQIGFDYALEAIANTHKIADMCNVELQLGKSFLPDFPIPPQFKDEDGYLRYLVNKGFRDRKLHLLPPEQRQVYINRLKEEFDIITAKGYSGYFLIVQDFLEDCRKEGILTGDGRGSADNSVVCYVLHITNVDAIKFDLDFSRFLTMERTELPDIDSDIQTSRRDDAITILRKKYGYDKVAQICSFGGLQAKAIMEAIGKVLGVNPKEVEKIKKCIPDQMTLPQALGKNSSLQLYKDKYPKLFEMCEKLEGLERSRGIHAGGIVICPSSMELTDFTGLAVSKDGVIVTQFEMHNVEKVGLVKMDMLGITTLDVIDDTLNLIYGEE